MNKTQQYYILLFATGLIQQYLSLNNFGKQVNGAIFLFAIAAVIYTGINAYRLKFNFLKIIIAISIAIVSFITGMTIMKLIYQGL